MCPLSSVQAADLCSSIVVACIGQQFLPTIGTETPSSLLWFTTIQGIESKQDLAGLAPKDCFIPAKPVERVAGQIGQAQKATCEVDGGSTGGRPTCHPEKTWVVALVKYG
jgi:hypothetical protein